MAVHEEWHHDGPIPPEVMGEPQGVDIDALIEDHYDTPGASIADDDRWRIDDDDAAEWALRKVATAEAELAALQEKAGRWQEQIAAWFANAAREPDRTVAFMSAHLEWYARRVREATDRATTVLPSGKIATTKQSPVAVIDDPEVLLEWARAEVPGLVRVREDVLITDLRAHTEVREREDGSEFVAWPHFVEDTGELLLDEVPGAGVRPGHITAKVVTK